MSNNKNKKQALKKFLKTTAAKEVSFTLSKIILRTDTSELKPMDKMNMEALLLFLKQVE